MKAKLIPIGNSKGIRIPMAILRQFDIDDEVNMEVEKGRIILQPAKKKPREGRNYRNYLPLFKMTRRPCFFRYG